MKVKVIKLYFDSRLNKDMKPDDVFDVCSSRGRALIQSGVVEEVIESVYEQPMTTRRRTRASEDE